MAAPFDTRTTIFFYASAQDLNAISLANKPDPKGLKGNVVLDGQLPVLGKFKLEITTGPPTNTAPTTGVPEAWADRPLDRTMYVSGNVPKEHLWKSKGNRVLNPPWTPAEAIQMLCSQSSARTLPPCKRNTPRIHTPLRGRHLCSNQNSDMATFMSFKRFSREHLRFVPFFSNANPILSVSSLTCFILPNRRPHP